MVIIYRNGDNDATDTAAALVALRDVVHPASRNIIIPNKKETRTISTRILLSYQGISCPPNHPTSTHHLPLLIIVIVMIVM
jgi:hypothetical protein